jgi:hypothetical protein
MSYVVVAAVFELSSVPNKNGSCAAVRVMLTKLSSILE